MRRGALRGAVDAMTALVLALAACVHHAGEPAARARGMEAARSTAEALNAALVPRRIALVVGIDNYDDPAFPPLAHAVHDAELLAGVLRDPEGGGFDRVEVLSGGPTRGAVLRQLQALGRDLRREDVLIVYFSGHGTRVPDAEAESQRRYLLQSNSRAADLETTAIELEALQAWFSGLPPARKALIVDACFNGDGKSVVRPAHRDVPVRETFGPIATVLAGGEAHLFATSPGRPALEDDQLGHGVYSYFLIEALSWAFSEADRDDDGVVTAWEAHDHARTHTLERTDGVQVPEASLRVVGIADLVLAGRPGPRSRRDRALVYLYPPPSHPLSGATLWVDGRARGSIPGTVAVDAGRHHLSIENDEGALIAEGHAKLAAGRPYRAEELARILRGPRLGVGLRPTVLRNPSGLHGTLGPVGRSLEAHGYLRDDAAPGRGALVGLRASVGAARGAADSESGGRFLGEAALAVGAQRDGRFFRARFGWSLGVAWAPPPGSRAPDAAVRRSELGWVYLTTGPEVTVGWVLGENLSLGLHGRLTPTWIDADGDGRPRPELLGAIAFGPEFVLR